MLPSFSVNGRKYKGNTKLSGVFVGSLLMRGGGDVGLAGGGILAGEDDEEFGADLPSGGGVAPHGEIGAGVSGGAVGVFGNPVSVLGGEGSGGRELDLIGCAHVGGVGFLVGANEFDVVVLGRDEGSASAHHDEVVREALGEGAEVMGHDGAIGLFSDGADVGFLGEREGGEQESAKEDTELHRGGL